VKCGERETGWLNFWYFHLKIGMQALNISLGKDFRLIDGLNRSSKLRNEKLKEGYCLSSILLRWTANIL